MPNFRAIGQSVWEKNGNRQTNRNTDRNTETQKDRLEFYKDRCMHFYVSIYAWLL